MVDVSAAAADASVPTEPTPASMAADPPVQTGSTAAGASTAGELSVGAAGVLAASAATEKQTLEEAQAAAISAGDYVASRTGRERPASQAG